METLGENLNMNSFLHKFFRTKNKEAEQIVIAEFTDEHDYPYEYKGVPMPKGKRFPLKIFSEKNVAFYDVNTDKWYQLVYARTFRDHWKIVG